MDTILQQLYEGNLDPVPQSQPMTQEYRAVSQRYYRHREDFRSTLQALDPAVSEQFDRLADEMLELDCLERRELFIDGFRLGARMMMEVFDGEDWN